MNKFWLAGATSLATGFAFAGAALAKTTTFTTPGVTTYLVQHTGTFDITAFGAQGGANTGEGAITGGLGAEIGGDITLAKGESLTLLVGGQGGAGNYTGGGGGGSFVALGSKALVVAGGGGGGAGGAGGGGGGGFTGAGGDGVYGGGGGKSFFAGGGGGNIDGGGGGGSFFTSGYSGVEKVATGGVRTGDGEITIAFQGASVPEPATWALMDVGVFGAGAALRGRRKRSRATA